VSVTPWPLLVPGKTQYPLYRSLGGPQGRSGQVRKISPPPGFDLRTVQSVASRYTHYATRSTLMSSGSKKKEPRYTCLSESKASLSLGIWAEVSSPPPHLHSGLSDSPVK